MSPEELLQSTLDAADEQRLRVGQGEAGPVYARENEHAYNAFEMQDEAFVPESVALTLATELTRLRAALAAVLALEAHDVWDSDTCKDAFDIAEKALVMP